MVSIRLISLYVCIYILYYIISYHIISYHIILSYIILYYIILYIILYIWYIILYHIYISCKRAYTPVAKHVPYLQVPLLTSLKSHMSRLNRFMQLELAPNGHIHMLKPWSFPIEKHTVNPSWLSFTLLNCTYLPPKPMNSASQFSMSCSSVRLRCTTLAYRQISRQRYCLAWFAHSVRPLTISLWHWPPGHGGDSWKSWAAAKR
jgi:hypothetical protein